MTKCQVEACDRDAHCKGFCHTHYYRAKRGKDFSTPIVPASRPFIERFWEKVQPEPNTGCWLWVGAATSEGYGQTWWNGKKWRAYRAAYHFYKEPIPDGLVIDHLCRQPSCVNPDHLEPVTRGENVRRGHAGKALSQRTHCKHGHPFSGENLALPKRGGRRCRQCGRDFYKRRKESGYKRRKENGRGSVL